MRSKQWHGRMVTHCFASILVIAEWVLVVVQTAIFVFKHPQNWPTSSDRIKVQSWPKGDQVELLDLNTPEECIGSLIVSKFSICGTNYPSLSKSLLHESDTMS